MADIDRKTLETAIDDLVALKDRRDRIEKAMKALQDELQKVAADLADIAKAEMDAVKKILPALPMPQPLPAYPADQPPAPPQP